MSKQKDPPTVIAALEVRASRHAEMVAAELAVKAAKEAYKSACAAVLEARKQADESLPQCMLVRSAWRGSRTEEAGRVVILRKTPGGLLVTRRVAETDEMRFKFSPYSGVYIKQRKGSTFMSCHYELRDVPPEWMPATTKESEQ